MDLGSIGFILVMFMLGNGLMGRVMGVEFIHVRMGAVMLGNSSGASSMGLATTISGNSKFKWNFWVCDCLMRNFFVRGVINWMIFSCDLALVYMLNYVMEYTYVSFFFFDSSLLICGVLIQKILHEFMKKKK